MAAQFPAVKAGRKATALAARSGLYSMRGAEWHKAGRSPN